MPTSYYHAAANNNAELLLSGYYCRIDGRRYLCDDFDDWTIERAFLSAPTPMHAEWRRESNELGLI